MSQPIDTRNQPGPVVFIIFGGAGDLTWRKLIPSLFNLHLNRSLPDKFAIIGVDRAAFNDELLRKRLHEGVRQFSNLGSIKAADWKAFAAHISYQRADFAAAKTYAILAKQLAALDKAWHAKPVHIFHLATPPSLVGVIPGFLASAGLARERSRARIVVEKPIGSDLESARCLNRVLTKSFRESQIFRIDHYLGKETVQNILAFRFANPMFEPIWNRRYVDYVTITVAEEVGVGHRGKYYEQAGELRDMVQNHLMQLLCLVAMEAPVSFSADEIRDKKVAVLHALRPLSHDEVQASTVCGQYGRGTIEGKRVRGYREEQDVAPDSRTETYAALQLFVDNWRWQDVPFYLRAGKRMARRLTEIVVQLSSFMASFWWLIAIVLGLAFYGLRTYYKTAKGKNNPAWGMNKSIANVLSFDNAADAVHLVACKTCFEVALFGEEAKDEKPYSALERIRTDEAARSRVKALLDGLLDESKELPADCLRWKTVADLE